MPARPPPPRALGLAPLAFFGLAAVRDLSTGHGGDLLWTCNVANVLLGVGLLLGAPRLVWIGVLWLLPGLPLWLWDVARTPALEVHSILTHVGGTLLGLLALRPQPTRAAWWQASLGGAAVQLVSHFATVPELNVNVSHAIYPPLAPLFPSYGLYLLASSVTLVACFYFSEIALTTALRRYSEQLTPAPPMVRR